MQQTFTIHTISGKSLKIVAENVKLVQEDKTKRMIYKFTDKDQQSDSVNFILADEVMAIFVGDTSNPISEKEL